LIGLLKRKGQGNISVGTRGMQVKLLRNPCESEGMFLMSAKGETRFWRRKGIQSIVHGDG